MMFLALLLGLVLDRIAGEVRRFHPLVGLGNCVQFVESRLNKPEHGFALSKLLGTVALLLILLPVIWLMASIVSLLNSATVLSLLFSALVLYLVLGWRSLAEHALAVHSALLEKNLSLARQRVGYMVSRETAELDAEAVTKATMESVLENGSDAVFAPIFWFVVAGPLGAIAYRVINTLDAMWGYRNERFIAFGWAAARLDDLVNWLPARLCALTYAWVSGRTGFQQGMAAWRQQAPQCESPNAGPVMACGAGALNVALGGDAVYDGKKVSRPVLGQGFAPVPGDIKRALQLVKQGVYMWVVLVLVVYLIEGLL